MKHISKRGLGIAAAVAIAASVAAIPAASAGGDDTRVEGKASFTASGVQIKLEDVKGDNNEGEGYFRYRTAAGAAYGRVLCVTGTKDGPGETAAIGLWIYKSNLPGNVAQGEFVLQWVNQKSGPDASLTQSVAGNLQCPADGFLFGTVPALVTADSGSYDVDVD